MPVVHLETFIRAPAQRCFDLMRDVEVHTRTTSRSNEVAVGGKTKGLLTQGDEVTWEAVHLGVKQVRVPSPAPRIPFRESRSKQLPPGTTR